MTLAIGRSPDAHESGGIGAEALEILGPTLHQSRNTPEYQESIRRLDARRAELEAKGRREATEEQVKIWQAWGESELKRIAREQGETTE